MTLPDRGWKLSLQTQDFRRCTLELSCGMGICPEKYGNDPEKAKEFVKAIYANVPVLDSGARALPRPLWSGDWEMCL